MERKKPVPFEVYRHFKGNLYQIITLAKHSEKDEELVVYQAMYGDFEIYARPLEMFMEKVAGGTYRFEKVEKIRDEENTVEVKTKPAAKENQPLQENNSEEGSVNPDLLAFLDARTNSERKNILVSIRPRITNRLIDDIAVSLDITIPDGDMDIRYENLLKTVATLGKYEISRN